MKFVDLIEEYKNINTKEEVINLVLKDIKMEKDGRALYHTDFFAVVFCYSKNKTFSNVVLSLSKLKKYDHIPCFVVVIKKDIDNVIYLMNTTFLDKISHSSKELRTDNIKGSLLGSNIRKVISEIKKENCPRDFNDLFLYHQGFTWQENIERLVENTNNIKSTVQKAELNQSEIENLYASPRRAIEFIQSTEYKNLLNDLKTRCENAKDAILAVSHIDNVNIRGRLIEILITSDKEERDKLLKNLSNIEHILPTYDTKNNLGDYIKSYTNFDSYTDIKSKMLFLDSNPKAYNIDKFLKCMGENKSVFFFFFIGIDEKSVVNTILCSVFHNELLDTTLLQHHWAGRGTRGVAQFNGKTINEILKNDNFTNNICEERCIKYLEELLQR